MYYCWGGFVATATLRLSPLTAARFPQLASWHYRGQNTKTVNVNNEVILMLLHAMSQSNAQNEVIDDPTDPGGTLPSNLPPEPTTGTEFKPLLYSEFDYKINLSV
jgi:hypothetical protein